MHSGGSLTRKSIPLSLIVLLISLILIVTGLLGSLAIIPAPAAGSFAVDSFGSWNSLVPCNSPQIVRISDITDNMTGSGSYNNSLFSPGTPNKRWLTPGPTPPGWQSPGPSCSITNPKGQMVASFVEIDGVGRAFWSYNDCGTNYNPVNGGSAYPPGHWCDSYGNLFDPSMVPNYSASCTSASDPTCWGRIHVEFDKDWMAAGYCGIGTASCNNNTMVQQTTANSATTLIDVQGFVYWDPDHLNTTFHSFSGWELHPLTAWRPHNSATTFSATFTHSPGSPTTGQAVTFTATVSGGTAPYSYGWSFGDGTTGTGYSTTHTYSSAGSYNVTLTVNDSSSPQQTATSKQTLKVVNPAPLTASFTHSPASPLVGQAVTFTGSAAGGVSPYSYSWSFGDGGNGMGSSVSHTYQSPGNYSVIFTVTDSKGQTAGSTQTITVSQPLSLTTSFTFSPSSPMAGQTVTFTASASGGTSPYSFTWNFGDGTSGAGSVVNHAYSTVGTFTVTSTVKDAGSPQQTASSQQSVTVSPAPLSASFSFSPSAPDAGGSISFIASASGGISPYTYSWSFGDGGAASGSNVSYTYQSSGSYTVSLTVTDSSGRTATASTTISVSPMLSASFTYSPSNPLPLLPVTFTANAAGGAGSYTYSWNFGDGSTGTGTSVSHSYLLPGTYTVTLTVRDADGQTVTTSQTITVLIPLPLGL